MKTKFLYNIQLLRGVAVLLVVFFHLMTVEKKYGGTISCLPDIFNYGMIGVDLFFVISGFIMVTITRGYFQNIKKSFTFLYNRIVRIYPTYWFYTLIIFVVYLIKPTIVNSSQGNQVDLVASFLLLPSTILPLVMVGWTLIYEMFFYIIFFLMLLFLPQKHLTKALIAWMIVIMLLDTLVHINSPFFNLISDPITIEFILGSLMAITLYKVQPKISNIVLISLIIFSFLVSIYIYYNYFLSNGDIDITRWYRVTTFGLPSLVVVFAFVSLEQNGLSINSMITKIGDASYSIYLSHLLTLNAIGRVWSKFSTDMIWDNYMMVPILIIASVIVGMVSYKYIEKPLIEHGKKLKLIR